MTDAERRAAVVRRLVEQYQGGVGAALMDAADVAISAADYRFNADLGPLRSFILPGGTPAAALLHVDRQVEFRTCEVAVFSSNWVSVLSR